MMKNTAQVTEKEGTGIYRRVTFQHPFTFLLFSFKQHPLEPQTSNVPFCVWSSCVFLLLTPSQSSKTAQE